MSSEIKVKKSYLYLIGIASILMLLTGVLVVTNPFAPEEKAWFLDGVEYTSYEEYYDAYVLKYGQAPEEPSDGVPLVIRDAADVRFNIHNAITDDGVSGSTTEVDITQVVAGETNLLSKKETVSVASNPADTAMAYPQGSILIFHALSDTDATGGTDHYDAWYAVVLKENNYLYEVGPSCFTVKESTPTYTYTFDITKGIKTDSFVSYTAGTTPYWDVGVFDVWPRVNATYLDLYLKHEGVTCSSITDGTGYDDTDAEVDANGTMTTTKEDLTFEIRGGIVDVGYGRSFLTLTQQGQLIERKAVLLLTTSMTEIGTSSPLNEGWSVFSKPDITAEVGFYYTMPSVFPVRGDKFIWSVDFPIDASAAASSTEFIFKGWMLDLQVENYIQSGSTSASVPTAYGFLNEFGIDAILFARALTVTSGAGDNEILRTYITTP